MANSPQEIFGMLSKAPDQTLSQVAMSGSGVPDLVRLAAASIISGREKDRAMQAHPLPEGTIADAMGQGIWRPVEPPTPRLPPPQNPMQAGIGGLQGQTNAPSPGMQDSSTDAGLGSLMRPGNGAMGSI
jgi:hypothetical protein